MLKKVHFSASRQVRIILPFIFQANADKLQSEIGEEEIYHCNFSALNFIPGLL